MKLYSPEDHRKSGAELTQQQPVYIARTEADLKNEQNSEYRNNIFVKKKIFFFNIYSTEEKPILRVQLTE